MVHRYSRLSGTRWLDLWLMMKAKIRRNRLNFSTFSLEKTAKDEDRELGEQELPPPFYHTLSSEIGLTSSLLSFKSLRKILFLHLKHRENAENVKKMDLEIQQMERMLGKLQTINEVISSKETPEECMLDSMVNSILNKLQASIIERNIFVRIYAENDVSFYSKSRLLYVILENLIENSIYYSSLGNSQSYVEINLRKEANDLYIRIEDNGIGIRKEAFNKIFNIFYKDSDQSNGSGLGLYIVREALQKLEGSIGLNSEEGCFTKIEVHIPASRSQTNLSKKDAQNMQIANVRDVQSV